MANEKNVERDLMTWSDRQPWRALMPKMYGVSVLGKRKRGDFGVRQMVVNVLLMHEVIASVYSQDQSLFREMWVPGDAELEEFWDHEESSEWYSLLPARFGQGCAEESEGAHWHLGRRRHFQQTR